MVLRKYGEFFGFLTWNVLVVLAVAWIVARQFTADHRARVTEFEKVVGYAKTSLKNRKRSDHRGWVGTVVESADGEID